ncbi:hypothetical protein NM688_g306 [Phlebia brevispora]|uniref:Uncharacterized protein n=1 Tax=Phlebia brevispora TaxID=194682 RepID=A0ACC1TEZ7_9APHY|nr:hypothetical protein NM688_g306 [Phlebia brevispora]
MEGEIDKAADIYAKLSQQLQKLSDQFDALSQVRGSKVLVPEHEDDLDHVVKTEEPWEIVHDAVKKQDEETLDSWKDELNNLLVFAGLFSGVVTAFTVQSYTWLQQDPGTATDIILARISLQLSSFVTMPGLTNSSAPAISLQDATSSFAPGSIAVPVNVLWVLSLTLSLVSAFFALAVQQWLRQLHLPADIPIRRAIQIHQLRQEGLQAWQTPGIIALLPLLLQIAVVLFLAGLYLLLQSLSTSVAVAFSAVAASAFLAFLAMTITPLIVIRCPYKSPLVPAVLVILQWLSYPFTAAVAGIGFTVVSAFGTVHGSQILDTLHLFSFYYWNIYRPYLRLLQYLKSFGRHMFVDIGQFWLLRERLHIMDLDGLAMERTILSRVLLSVPSRAFVNILRSLRTENLGPSWWENLFEVAGLHTFGPMCARIALHDTFSTAAYTVLRRKTVRYVSQWPSVRLRCLGWRALHERPWGDSQQVTYEDGARLTLFHELSKIDNTTSVSQQFFKYLLGVCANQQISEHCWLEESAPACIMLDILLNSDAIDIGEDTAQQVVDYATKSLQFLADRRTVWEFELPDVLTLSLWVCACAFAVTVRCLSIPCLALMGDLADLLSGDEEIRALRGVLEGYYDAPDNVHRLLAIPDLLRSISMTLSDLSDENIILRDPLCPSIRFSHVLREVCSTFTQHETAEVCASLDDFIARIPDWDPIWRVRGLLEEGLDGHLVALMLIDEISSGTTAGWDEGSTFRTMQIAERQSEPMSSYAHHLVVSGNY